MNIECGQRRNIKRRGRERSHLEKEICNEFLNLITVGFKLTFLKFVHLQILQSVMSRKCMSLRDLRLDCSFFH